MNEVLTRSLATTVSTLVGVIALLIFGGETLTAFAIAILVGITSGTYSSLFIASPVLALWKEREPAYRRRARQQMESQGYIPAFAEEHPAFSETEAEARAAANASARAFRPLRRVPCGGGRAGGREAGLRPPRCPFPGCARWSARAAPAALPLGG